MAELEALAGRLRSLVAQGRYQEAQGCFAAYGQALEAALRQLSPGDTRIRDLETSWRRLLDRIRRQVLVGRAHAAFRLAHLPHPGLYSPPAAPRHNLDLFG